MRGGLVLATLVAVAWGQQAPDPTRGVISDRRNGTERKRFFEFSGGLGTRFRGSTKCSIGGNMAMIVDSGWSLSDEQFATLTSIASGIMAKKCIEAGTEDILVLNYGSGLSIPTETYAADDGTGELAESRGLIFGDEGSDRRMFTRKIDETETTTAVNEAVVLAVTNMTRLTNDANAYMLNFEYPLDEAIDKLSVRPTEQTATIFITDGDFGVNQTILTSLVYSAQDLSKHTPVVILVKDPASATSSYIDRNTAQGSYTTRTTNMPALLLFTSCYSVDDCPNIIQVEETQTVDSVVEAVVEFLAAQNVASEL